MIVISGALVAVALILLVIGLTVETLTLIYASVAVSAASLVFLLIGSLQRRAGVPVQSLPATDAPVSGATSAASPDEAPSAGPAGNAAGGAVAAERPAALESTSVLTGMVHVVEGRPRYHDESCRYLSGRDVEGVDVMDARAEGYTECGVCSPDAALAERRDAL